MTGHRAVGARWPVAVLAAAALIVVALPGCSTAPGPVAAPSASAGPMTAASTTAGPPGTLRLPSAGSTPGSSVPARQGSTTRAGGGLEAVTPPVAPVAPPYVASARWVCTSSVGAVASRFSG